MRNLALAILVSLPWTLGPALTIWRVRRSRDLADVPPAASDDGPLVSVIIPARNERRNIERSAQAALAASWPNVEVIVVDDRSTDGTGEIARAMAARDSRVRVVETSELPAGWFGKPWACATGAAHARGDILCFTDADARHGPELVTRAVTVMRAQALDMLTVAGHQELGSFWERVVQPHVFWMLATRYGGTESVNRSRRVEDKIANGQCIFVRRSAYDALGGHGAVHDRVAEDVALAQRMFAAGMRTALIMGRHELTTRMYESLREIMAGWRKNVFAGGREAMPWGRSGQLIFPALLVLAPVMTLLPPATLVAASLWAVPSWLANGAAIAVVAQLVTWALVYRWMAAPVVYAPLFPLGAGVFAVIALQAIARGSRVEWKDRAYVATNRARTRP
ncbi:MAG TPA: glycosyltransferase [Gemmatimonadaceae bacterium]|nr:glycosyltransferase [Gemmatimonadaceae bacterium]